ncbi:uncharacterized protein [Porites lutea]|uniref:uncharacterized protein n=1 Tax=Porites lutea TaxID=51062 RepID=UPI003CC5FF3B
MGNAIKIEGVEGLEIKEKLGEGSFGEVYKAKWNGNLVAVKRLKEEVAWGHPKALEQFKRECTFLRELDHPNIVKLLDAIFPQGNLPVLITELLFCDLFTYYNDSKTTPKVSLDETIKIMLDVGEGLKFLHVREDPIVHRDIKSHNILLDSKLRAKIADLGQAKEFPGLGAGRCAAATPVPGGTTYMAPETFPSSSYHSNCRLVDYGAKMDIFSFGVVLLEVTVGHVPSPRPLLIPYDRDGHLVPEHSRRRKELGEMGTLHPLRDMVLQCLENDPKRRPTIIQVIKGLQRNDGSQRRIELKIAVLGSSGVGKSLLIKRYVDSDFPFELVRPTIGVDHQSVPLEIGNQLVILRIVDPAGQERFDSIAPALFRGSHGAFLVYDISEQRSFAALPKYLDFIATSCGEDVKVMLIGNKADLPRQVNFESAQNYATFYKMEHLEVSAKTLDNVDEMFERLARKILDSLDESDIHILEKTISLQQSRIHLTDGEQPKSGCNC